MANRELSKIERIMKDFSQDIGSGSGMNNTIIVNVKYTGEDLLEGLLNNDQTNWSQNISTEKIEEEFNNGKDVIVKFDYDKDTTLTGLIRRIEPGEAEGDIFIYFDATSKAINEGGLYLQYFSNKFFVSLDQGQ